MKKALKSLAAGMLVIVAVLAFGAGCAGPAYVSGRRVAPALADDVVHVEARMDTADGLKLLVQSWKPKTETKGALIIVHGLKDYGDRYVEFCLAAARRGYSVHTLDLRGHGDSEGDRVWVDRFDEYLNDLGLFLKRVQREEPGKKVFLMGHSMGGAIVTLFTITEQPKLAGLITSAGALDTDTPAGLRGVVRFFSVVAPRLAVLEVEDANLSRDPRVVESMKNDPLIFDGKGPARAASEVIGAIARIHEHPEKVTVPLLALHGTLDKVTPPGGSAWLVANAGSTDKKELKFEGLVHDLLHEPERAQVMEAVLAWMDVH